MSPSDLKKLISDVRTKKISVDKAMQRLKTFSCADVDFAKIDHHRHLRLGFPEVVFCDKKTDKQARTIIQRLLETHHVVLATHASAHLYEKLIQSIPDAVYKEEAAAIIVDRRKKKKVHKGVRISIATAGTSDIPIAEESALIPELVGIPVKRFYDIGVAGLHRLLNVLPDFTRSSVIIVIAGMDGVLPGVIAGLVDVPVIGVPVSVGYGSHFSGITPLLTMLNSCAAGLAVMNIDNGFGAGFLAMRIMRQIIAKSAPRAVTNKNVNRR